MPRAVGIDHIVFRVSDLARSKRFYDRLLGCLGFTREWEFGVTVGWDNGITMVCLAEADAEGRKHTHRTGDVGFHHYAFELATRADVDALYAELKTMRARIVDPPANYPSYGEGYYAVFFLDPDGIKLEGVHFAEKRKRLAAAARAAKRPHKIPARKTPARKAPARKTSARKPA